MKKFDDAVEGKIPTGFEMLVNNFSAGILGLILALLAYSGIGPAVEFLNNALESGLDVIVSAKLLPLASIVIEPAKILFLNNAINHGILGPHGAQQAPKSASPSTLCWKPTPVLAQHSGSLLCFWQRCFQIVGSGAMIIHFLRYSRDLLPLRPGQAQDAPGWSCRRRRWCSDLCDLRRRQVATPSPAVFSPTWP